MIKVKISKDWENLDELEAASFIEEMWPSAVRTMKEVLLFFEGVVKKKLTGTRSGRTYRVPLTRGGPRARTHVASAPGEPPAVLFGALRNSIGHTGPEKVSQFELEGEVGSGLGQSSTDGSPDPSKSYARRLELGGADSRGRYIAPRPYMTPSAEEAEPKIDRIIRKRLGS